MKYRTTVHEISEGKIEGPGGRAWALHSFKLQGDRLIACWAFDDARAHLHTHELHTLRDRCRSLRECIQHLGFELRQVPEPTMKRLEQALRELLENDSEYGRQAAAQFEDKMSAEEAAEV